MSFDVIREFENEVARFFGAPYAVAVDCCTHGLELCLRYLNSKYISVPERTYISVPFLSEKLNIELRWRQEDWQDYYYLNEQVIDAAVLWKKNSYISGKYMCVSFQYRKHLSLGRGGVILVDDKESAIRLRRMAYDGRFSDKPWREQDIDMVGYHYYMTPEIAKLGLEKLPKAISSKPKKWTVKEWPNLRNMKIFKEKR